MSTVSPGTSRKAAEQHRGYGAGFVAAPVFGRPEAAAARKLWVCISGEESAKARSRPILSSLGQGTFDIGADPGAANVVKLAGNFLLVTVIESLGEALALGEKHGIPRATLAEMLTTSLFPCPVYQNYGKKIAEESYSDAGFRLSLGLKDVNLVMRTAEEAGVQMPVAELLKGRMEKVLQKGRGDWDWSALAMLASEEARSV